MARSRLTFRRLAGLDRSGPPPPQTLRGQPLNPWTIPNAIGLVRFLLIPLFLVLAFDTDTGTEPAPAIVFAVIAWSDYADGMAARITGQYSRLGAMLDPAVDRLLVVAGIVVCWDFELLPRWALAALVIRELGVGAAGQIALRRGLDLEINWFGRWAVWPTMGSLFFALAGMETTAEILLYIGLALSYTAWALYIRSTMRRLAEMRRSGTSTSA